MINCIKDTDIYKSLNLVQNLNHAYLFYSIDKVLNNNIALTFAKSLICSTLNSCGVCPNCKQFESNSHPDITIIDQESIKVEDINKLMPKLATLPVSTKYKVFVILNAENINEIAQNKLLKSLEEPNSSTIFILTTSKTDKILPTVMSRLKKIFIPRLEILDKSIIARELKGQNLNVTRFLESDLNLTELINVETNTSYVETMRAIELIFTELKASSDIPQVASKVQKVDKNLFFPLMQDIFIDCINKTKKYDPALTTLISLNFPEKSLVKSLPHIELAYKMQMSNVNFSYILDNLLFNILKEKFLCKQ